MWKKKKENLSDFYSGYYIFTLDCELQISCELLVCGPFGTEFLWNSFNWIWIKVANDAELLFEFGIKKVELKQFHTIIFN